MWSQSSRFSVEEVIHENKITNITSSKPVREVLQSNRSKIDLDSIDSWSSPSVTSSSKTGKAQTAAARWHIHPSDQTVVASEKVHIRRHSFVDIDKHSPESTRRCPTSSTRYSERYRHSVGAERREKTRRGECPEHRRDSTRNQGIKAIVVG